MSIESNRRDIENGSAYADDPRHFKGLSDESKTPYIRPHTPYEKILESELVQLHAVNKELLGALETMLDEVLALVDDGTLPNVDDHPSVRKARAAIAKAKGK